MTLLQGITTDEPILGLFRDNVDEEIPPANLLAVGGIKDKVLAASRVGLNSVILPRQNENDQDSIPHSIRNRIRFVLADHIDEVLKECLSELVDPHESSIEAAVEAIQDKDER